MTRYEKSVRPSVTTPEEEVAAVLVALAGSMPAGPVGADGPRAVTPLDLWRDGRRLALRHVPRTD